MSKQCTQFVAASLYGVVNNGELQFKPHDVIQKRVGI